ncbi:Mediator of RNA polymerase II transcription subunit 15a [Linum grandiflorum]
MDGNNWRPPAPGGEAAMEGGDWRATLQADSRQRIVNKIMETLKRHLPFSGQEGLQELKKIAIRFEEKIYTAATSQSDYLRKISLKMLTMESKSQPLNSAGGGKPPDPGASPSIQSQVPSQGQSIPIPLAANQAQGRQQLMPQNMQNNMNPAGLQGSATLQTPLPAVSGMNQTPINVAGQNASMQNMSNIAQNPVATSMGQGVSSNMFGNPHRQMPGRNQVIGQQQQQSQNPQYLYSQQQQQFQQQLLLKQRNLTHPMMQPQLQQQQQPQQNALQSSQFQQPQQSGVQSSSVMQPSMMQSASMQNQSSSVQQSTQPMLQQSLLSTQQQPQVLPTQQQQQQPQQQQQQQQQQPMHSQQQMVGQQANSASMQQNQFVGQQNNMGDPQQQRLLNQQTNHQNQQQQQSQQQQMMAQHQQLGSQSNFSGLQQPTQQQLLGTQSGNSSMQNNQHAINMLHQSKVPLQQQTQQNSSNLLPSQGQQTQSLASQQQLMSQIQPHPAQATSLQREMHHRLQASGQTPGTLVQPQNVVDQQKPLYQSQRALPETSSTSLDSTAQTGQTNGMDWQEEVYQKIKAMKEMYLPELNEMFLKIASKLHQHDSLPQPPKSDQLDKLKMFKTMLERMINFLQVPKESVIPSFKDKLASYEKQIMSFLTTNRPKKPMPQMQQGQLPPSHMQPLQQAPSQNPQSQSHENQMNPQLQSMNMQSSVSSMQQNNMSNMQHGLSGVSASQQSMMNSLQPGSNIDSSQGNAMASSQGAMGSIQHNSSSTSQQQANIGAMPSQSGLTILQQTQLQSTPNMLQQHHLKQQQHDQQVLQSQQFKQQYQQRQMHQMLQQRQHHLNQQAKQQQQQQQLPTQLQTQQMPQLHQMNDTNEMKIRQGLAGVKPGVFQQHLSNGQRAGYPPQQMKSGASFPISSPQMLQTPSPQLLQHSSPQVDQQNLHPSLPKTGTPLQSAHSPFVVPSPSTPSASPIPCDSAVSDIGSVVSMIDRIAGSAPGNGSRAAVGEDLVAMTKCRLQARNFITQDGISGTRKMRRFTSAMPLNVITSAGGVSDGKQWSGAEISDLESTATSGVKRPRLEANHALLEEIREINQRLIDTVVDISDEDVNPSAEGGEGTIVKCSYCAVALSPGLKARYNSAQMSQIQPLRLLVPLNYPNCSPVLLDKFPVESSSKEYEDVAGKAKSRFSISLRSLSQPMSLGEIVRTWDVCVRAVISEYAQQNGGGTFSSKYGTWENCLTAT